MEKYLPLIINLNSFRNGYDTSILESARTK